jgi:hypothetical protein
VKYSIIAVMSLFSTVLWDASLYSMDPLLIDKISDKKNQSLKRVDKAIQGAWSFYNAEDHDNDKPTFRISIFTGPAQCQEKSVSEWIEGPFHQTLWKGGSSPTNYTQEPLVNGDRNCVKFVSRGKMHPICINEDPKKKPQTEIVNYPMTVLNVDTDFVPLPQDLFQIEPIQKPMVIVLHESLVLNKAVMENLRDQLESLGDLYEADNVLKKLNGF